MDKLSQDSQSNSSLPQRRKADSRRLDSWKAIAAYMNRSVRTVRRWESSQRLPVHRLRHNAGSSVFAYESELERWRLKNQISYDGQPSATEVSTDSTPRKIQYLYAAGLVIAILGGALAGRLSLSDASVDDPGSLVFKDASFWPESTAQVLTSQAFAAWSRNDLANAERHMHKLEKQLSTLPESLQLPVVDYLVEMKLILGRLEAARALALELPAGRTKNMLDTRIAFAAGDMSLLKDVLDATADRVTDEAMRMSVVDAMTALTDGDTRTARALLDSVTTRMTPFDQGYFFVALDLLARTHAAEGQLDAAVTILERTMGHKEAAAKNRAALFWLMCQRQLAVFYRSSGDDDAADQIESQLRELLGLADAQFPLAKSLGLT